MQKSANKGIVAWYRIPVMWLVVALPAIALIGSAIVLALTQIRPDAEVHSERLADSAVQGPR